VPGLRAWYLNRLAVNPSVQGSGIGRWCLTHLTERARTDRIEAIRCDVLAANLALRRFYQRAGYRDWGTRTHSGWEFACYELRVA